jgi:hypothetical protein
MITPRSIKCEAQLIARWPNGDEISTGRKNFKYSISDC